MVYYNTTQHSESYLDYTVRMIRHLVTLLGANDLEPYDIDFIIELMEVRTISSFTSGVNTATVSVPTSTNRTDATVNLRVEDVNSGCSPNTSGSASYTIGFCDARLDQVSRGKTLPAILTSIEASPITGLRQHCLKFNRTDNTCGKFGYCSHVFYSVYQYLED